MFNKITRYSQTAKHFLNKTRSVVQQNLMVMISLVPNAFPATFKNVRKGSGIHCSHMCLISALEQVSVLQAEIKQLKQVKKYSHPVCQKPCFRYVHLSGETMSDGHLLGETRHTAPIP